MIGGENRNGSDGLLPQTISLPAEGGRSFAGIHW